MRAWYRRQAFLLNMGLALLLGWLATSWFAKGGTLHMDLLQPFLVGAIFCISGLILPTKALLQATLRLRVHVALQLFILGLLPAIGWAIVATGVIDHWNPSLRSGVLILACLPTTITSCVVLTRTAGGDEALALVGAASGSVLGVAICPWTILALTGVRPEAPLQQIVWNLCYQTLLPLAVGQLIRWKYTTWCDHYRPILGIWSNRCFLLILPYVVATTFASGAVAVDGTMLLNGLLAALCGLALSLSLAGAIAKLPWLRLDRRGQIAFRLCGSQKSAAIGVPLILLLAAGRDDVGLLCLPIILFHASQLIIGGILADRWHRQGQALPKPCASA